MTAAGPRRSPRTPSSDCTNAGARRCPSIPGWTYRVWAVDVDGERLFLSAHGPDATAAEQGELATKVETFRFVAAPSS
jgi:hypothetical protein